MPRRLVYRHDPFIVCELEARNLAVPTQGDCKTLLSRTVGRRIKHADLAPLWFVLNDGCASALKVAGVRADGGVS